MKKERGRESGREREREEEEEEEEEEVVVKYCVWTFRKCVQFTFS